MFSLMQTAPEPVPKVGELVCDQDVVCKCKIDRTIYMTVVLRLYPKKNEALITWI